MRNYRVTTSNIGRNGSTKQRAELLATATREQHAEYMRRRQAARELAYSHRVAEKIAARLRQAVEQGKLGKSKCLEELWIIGRDTARSYGVAASLVGECLEQAGLALVKSGAASL